MKTDKISGHGSISQNHDQSHNIDNIDNINHDIQNKPQQVVINDRNLELNDKNKDAFDPVVEKMFDDL